MKKILVLLLLMSLALFAKSNVTLAIVTDGKYVTDITFVEKIEDEISKLLENDYNVHYKLFQSKKESYLDVATQVNYAINDKSVNIVLPIGVLASHYASRKHRYFKPLIAVNVLDHVMQKIPFKNGHSNKKNFSYFERFFSLESDIKQMKTLVPMKNALVLIQKSLIKNSPSIKRYLKRKFTQNDINATILGVSKDFKQELSGVEFSYDMIYVTPLLFLSEQERSTVYSILSEKELKSFSALGADDVVLGALFSIAPKINLERLARHIALDVHQIQSGSNPAQFDVLLHKKRKLSINMATAESVNYSPSWSLLSDAELIDEQKSDSHYFSIEDIIQRALEYNLNLKSIKYTQKLKEINTQVLSAPLLPQIHLVGAVTQIDSDRADASLGTLDESSGYIGANFTQSLYAQAYSAKVEAQEFVAQAASKEVEFIKEDISLAAALNYLQILQLQDELKINKENFSLSQENLRSANVRQTLGSGSNGDIYRWESKIAADKQAVIQTHSLIEAAGVKLNALLDLDQNMPLNFQKIKENNPIFLTSRQEIYPYLQDSRRFKVFQEFLVQEALTNAPELEKYAMLTKARKKLVASNKLAFFTPDILLKADINYRVMQSQTSTSVQLPQEIQNLPKADDTSWNFGVFADFPLYIGDATSSKYEASKVALLATNAAEAQQRNDIEQRVRDALLRAKASYLSMELSSKSYNAARKNFALMKSIYAEGGINIIHLLDAQNAMLKAARLQIRTKYKFMVDILRMQRSIGRVDFNVDDATFHEWLKRLEAFEKEKQEKGN